MKPTAILNSRTQMLSNIAMRKRLRRACEVGVFRCEFSREIVAFMRRDGRLDLVDTFGPGGVGSGDVDGGFFTVVDGDVLRREAVEYAMTVDGGARVAVYAMSSLEWARIATGACIQYDFVYLDADHSYDSVASDISAYWPLVSPGGWLCGHDYSATTRCKDTSHLAGMGVGRAVDEFVDALQANGSAIEFNLAMDGYSSFAIRKPSFA